MKDALALIGGMILGFAYFANLLWSTRRLAKMKHPVFTMLISYFLRIGLTATTFFLISWITSLRYGLVFLAGFFLMKICFLWKHQTEKVRKRL